MLRQTFCHIKGVSEKGESALWHAGIQDWHQFFEPSDRLDKMLSANKIKTLTTWLQDSESALDRRDHRFFSGFLPPQAHWRLFREFRDRTAYVDIETTGLSKESNEITTIALYDGQTIRHYINGVNLEAFPEDIQAYDLLVTYNGKCFDLPFMAKFFQIEFHHSHIDLRYVLKSLGYSGGLKGCEKQFGLARRDLEGVDGYFAVLLWQTYQSTKQTNALETLLAYNIEDVINLEFLMHQAYNLKIKELPMGSRLALAIPERPDPPFLPDTGLIEKLKARLYPPFMQ